MPIPAHRKRADGSLIPFTPTEIDALRLRTRGIKDGAGGRRRLRMGSSTRHLRWFCDREQFWDAAVFLAGAVSLVIDGSTGQRSLSRIPPWTDPEDPNLGITEVEEQGWRFVEDATDDDGVPLPDYTESELACLAEILPYQRETDEDFTGELYRYVERLADEQTAEYLNMPGVSLGLKLRKPDNTGPAANEPGGTPVQYNTGFALIKGRISFKWWRVPREAIEANTPLFNRLYGDPDSNDIPYVGCSNKTSFQGFRPGTLVLLAPKVEPVFDGVAGDWCVNITYSFDFLPHGANYLYNFKGTPGWFLATRGDYAAPGAWADGDVLFPAREMLDIFDVGTV